MASLRSQLTHERAKANVWIPEVLLRLAIEDQDPPTVNSHTRSNNSKTTFNKINFLPIGSRCSSLAEYQR